MLDKLKANADIFLAVTETGSFRKAAEQLGYTQAGISYIINSIEEECGLTLFAREHNGVRLTPEGESLLGHMHQLKIWERQLQSTVDELSTLKKGTVRVQIFDSISVHWIPGILKKFHDDYPGIQVELISEEDSVRAEEMVTSGEVDCGFFLTDVVSKIDTIPLLEESVLAVVAKDSEIAKLDKFPLAKLGDYPYIAMKFDRTQGTQDIFRRAGIKPNIAFRMDNDYAALAMVSKGLGFCIFPELLLKYCPYEIHAMEFDKSQHRTIRIGTASMDTASRACRKFIEYTLAWIRENHSQLK